MILHRTPLPKCTLMIATYNWPDALYLCLMSVLSQSHLPDEIIIADDGSTASTKDLIDKISLQTPVPVVHIWHPDKNFQLSSIRNKAILAAQYEYIIQIDGDIILNKYFIYDHLHMAAKKSFICGSRVSLTSKISTALLKHKNYTPKLKDISLGYIMNAIRLPFFSPLLTNRYKRKQLHVVRGCNMSFWREDLISINGYNEDITGWGAEDSEIAIRLMNLSIKKRFLKFAGIMFHIYHKENSRSSEKRNYDILNQTIKENKTWINNGIIKQPDEHTTGD
ncbi:MAG: glycosyltransferase family 2 protein [Bacteroidota bacterium]